MTSIQIQMNEGNIICANMPCFASEVKTLKALTPIRQNDDDSKRMNVLLSRNL